MIIGHSERRQYYHDSDPEVVFKKTVAALEAGLTQIVCVGEMLAERESGKTEEVLVTQFREGLASLTAEQFAKVVVAYEPVWAIGTEKTATPPQIASDAHAVIRKKRQLCSAGQRSEGVAHSVRRQREARQREDTDG